MASTPVSFLTADGVTIVGDWYAAGAGSVALALHMMPATKESWRAFADALLEAGFGGVLAIDLRGHGESRESTAGILNYRSFSDQEHARTIEDVRAVLRWFAEEQKISTAQTVLVGASIGANLAIVVGAEQPDIPAIVALSPGLDYHGVRTLDAVKVLRPAQHLLLAASAEDEESMSGVNELAIWKTDAIVHRMTDAGHGTAMFAAKPEFMHTVIAWLAAKMT